MLEGWSAARALGLRGFGGLDGLSVDLRSLVREGAVSLAQVSVSLAQVNARGVRCEHILKKQDFNMLLRSQKFLP